jgi:CRP-like cAMP-binding protein
MGKLSERWGCRVLPEPATAMVSPDLLTALHHLKPVKRFSIGAILFQCGSAAAGIYLIESGQVRLLLPTGSTQKQLVEVVGPGILLGLSENMSGEKHRTTAETGEQTAAVFIPREEFLVFLREHSNFCMQVVRLLSADLHKLYQKFRGISAHPGRPRQRPLMSS